MKDRIDEAIRIIAKREGITEREVLDSMQEAMDAGMHSSDPAVRARWAGIPRQGEKPAPREVIEHILHILDRAGRN